MKQQSFTLTQPDTQTTPIIFASPHSGRDYPREFRANSVLGDLILRSSEDAFVDLLFGAAPLNGAPFLCANLPRAYLDLNRGVEELDAALIEGVSAKVTNPRISSGLGVIPRVVSGGRAIYRGKIRLNEAERRIGAVWHPYHAQLARLLHGSHKAFGQAILIDCHSMPREAVESIDWQGGATPDVILGDRFGAAADKNIVDQIEAILSAAGFTVARNKPFAGAYIAQTYGRPLRGQHVVQIEVNRALYLDETLLRPNSNFQNLKSTLNGVVAEISNIGRKEISLAAE